MLYARLTVNRGRDARRGLVLLVFLVEERTLQHKESDGAVKQEQDGKHKEWNLLVNLGERSSDEVD